MEITRLATKLLGPPEEINDCSHRASRWTIFGNHHFTLHLYRVIGDGWRRANDYPKQFISVGLVKPYVEETANEFEAFPDLVGWMLLIGKRSQDSGNSPHHYMRIFARGICAVKGYRNEMAVICGPRYWNIL